MAKMMMSNIIVREREISPQVPEGGGRERERERERGEILHFQHYAFSLSLSSPFLISLRCPSGRLFISLYTYTDLSLSLSLSLFLSLARAPSAIPLRLYIYFVRRYVSPLPLPGRHPFSRASPQHSQTLIQPCMWFTGRAKPVLRGPNSTESTLSHHGETTYRVG